MKKKTVPLIYFQGFPENVFDLLSLLLSLSVKYCLYLDPFSFGMYV